MYYIVDTYSPYERNKDVKYTFEYNGALWCIREISEFEWGKPQFAERPLDDEYIEYHIYDSYAAALAFCHELKGVYI